MAVMTHKVVTEFRSRYNSRLPIDLEVCLAPLQTIDPICVTLMTISNVEYVVYTTDFNRHCETLITPSLPKGIQNCPLVLAKDMHTPKKCECGVASIGGSKHSHYCPLHI